MGEAGEVVWWGFTVCEPSWWFWVPPPVGSIAACRWSWVYSTAVRWAVPGSCRSRPGPTGRTPEGCSSRRSAPCPSVKDACATVTQHACQSCLISLLTITFLKHHRQATLITFVSRNAGDISWELSQVMRSLCFKLAGVTLRYGYHICPTSYRHILMKGLLYMK